MIPVIPENKLVIVSFFWLWMNTIFVEHHSFRKFFETCETAWFHLSSALFSLPPVCRIVINGAQRHLENNSINPYISALGLQHLFLREAELHGSPTSCRCDARLVFIFVPGAQGRGCLSRLSRCAGMITPPLIHTNAYK